MRWRPYRVGMICSLVESEWCRTEMKILIYRAKQARSTSVSTNRKERSSSAPCTGYSMLHHPSISFPRRNASPMHNEPQNACWPQPNRSCSIERCCPIPNHHKIRLSIMHYPASLPYLYATRRNWADRKRRNLLVWPSLRNLLFRLGSRMDSMGS